MRFEQIHIGRFGRLKELRTPDEGLPNLVAILGPNEGGKSTFFSFLTTLLFGFSPANRETHPYSPWSGGDAEGRARIRLDDGSLIEIHRRLLSNGWGRLISNDQTEDIRNLPLPMVSHVPRAVFQQVFALTLAELASLEGESWDLVQDRLVGAMGATDLVPGRSVAAAFDKTAGSLWRPTRRGNQEARVLAGLLAEMKAERRSAVDLDRELRSKVRELKTGELQLRQMRENRERERVMEYRLSRLLPVRRKLQRIDDLKHEVGDTDGLDELPTDPQGRLDELRDRYEGAEGRIKRLDSEMAGPRSVVSNFTGQHQVLADNEERVRRAADRIAALQDLRDTANEFGQEVRDLERRCEVQAQDLFSGPWLEVDGQLLREMPTGELRDRIRKYQSTREKRRIAEEGYRRELAAPVSPPSQMRLGLGVGIGAVGLVMLALAALAEDKTLPMVLGFSAIVISAVSLAQWWDAQNNVKRFDTEKAEAERLNSRRVWDLKADETKGRDRILELIVGLVIHEGLLDAPTLDLPASLERMQELMSDREDRVRSLSERLTKLQTAEEEISSLNSSLNLPILAGDHTDSNSLYRALKDSLGVREEARAAERDLDRIRSEKQQAETELNEISALAHSLARRLIRIGEGDLRRGVEEATRRIGLRERSRQLIEDLEREFPDLEALLIEIKEAEAGGEAWSFDQEALAMAAARREELTEQVENLRAAVETLKIEIQHLEKSETVDQVDGRIQTTRDNLSTTVWRRDRAFVIAQIVREAERRFREEHQPDILLRAGLHLGLITGGKYDRILAEGGDDTGFFLSGPGISRPIRVGNPISTGTQEQVYLALRLAIVDHLDARGERLPLFMDEAFVNWDAERRERAFGLLKRISTDRQIFFFTCHAGMAAELEDQGGRVIVLSEMTSRPTTSAPG